MLLETLGVFICRTVGCQGLVPDEFLVRTLIEGMDQEKTRRVKGVEFWMTDTERISVQGKGDVEDGD